MGVDSEEVLEKTKSSKQPQRMVQASVHPSESHSEETSLRPRFLKEYIGQEKIKEVLDLFLKAAQQRQDALDHALLVGPPGLGKTTLATIIAHELGTQLHSLSGPNIEKKGDLAAVLSNLSPRDVLFIDEIHRLNRTIEEVLYSAMEDFKLDLIVGQGVAARTLRIDLPPFTLVGATTRSGLLSSPLRDRFGIHLRLDFYPPEELKQIVLRSSELLKVGMDREASQEIAKRSRGTPRVANRLLKRVRDYSQVKAPRSKVIDLQLAQQALALFEIDQRGLDGMDRRLLNVLITKFDGGPVGIESLASALGEESETLEEICEPFLIQEGFLQRTPRGRLATRRAFEHLGIPTLPEEVPSFI